MAEIKSVRLHRHGDGDIFSTALARLQGANNDLERALMKMRRLFTRAMMRHARLK